MSNHVCTCDECVPEPFVDTCKHEREAERLVYALKDARSFVLSVQRHVPDYENQATGLLSRIDAGLREVLGE